jgi:hypothetical protein
MTGQLHTMETRRVKHSIEGAAGTTVTYIHDAENIKIFNVMELGKQIPTFQRDLLSLSSGHKTGSKFLRNTGNYVPSYTVSHPLRQYSLQSSPQ